MSIDKEAEDPSVVGGAAVAGADPVPRVGWEEQDGKVSGSGNNDQIELHRRRVHRRRPRTARSPSECAVLYLHHRGDLAAPFAQAAVGGPNCVIFEHCDVDVDVDVDVPVHGHGHRAHIRARLRGGHKIGIVVDRGSARHPKRVGRVPLGMHRKGKARSTSPGT